MEIERLQVRWLGVDLDPLSNYLTVVGRLIRPAADDPASGDPIDFSQGLTVAISRTPEVPLGSDWWRQCVLRAAPVLPTVDPVVAAERLCQSQKISQLEENHRDAAVNTIRVQAINMLPPHRKPAMENANNWVDPSRWEEAVGRSGAEPLVWIADHGFASSTKPMRSHS